MESIHSVIWRFRDSLSELFSHSPIERVIDGVSDCVFERLG